MRTKPILSLEPGLYLVATPIGNLSDISLRALGTLEQVDLIICEDTRVTSRLLTHYGINKPLWIYHDHNAASMRPKILARLQESATIALVSDAGTPTLADPGYKLVQAALDADIKVFPIPGPMAGIVALTMSGLATDAFFFGGFLPPKSAARRTQLSHYRTIPGTLVFYESPRRLLDMLTDCLAVLGNRSAAVCRELTKIYEEARRESLEALVDYYQQNPDVKGEIVVVIDGPSTEPVSSDVLEAALHQALAQGLDRRAAVTHVVETYGAPKRIVYQMALEIYGARS